jgi:hypothetical protein
MEAAQKQTEQKTREWTRQDNQQWRTPKQLGKSEDRDEPQPWERPELAMVPPQSEYGHDHHEAERSQEETLGDQTPGHEPYMEAEEV